MVACDGDGVPLEPGARGDCLARRALIGGACRRLLDAEAARVAEESVRVRVWEHDACTIRFGFSCLFWYRIFNKTY